MSRIPLTPPRTVRYRLAEWWCRRSYGRVLDPVKAMGHHPRALMADARLERAVAGWQALDPELKALAVMASAAAIGCSWCMDFGYWEFRQQGMDRRKLHDVPVWRDSDAYSPLERSVMEYAEAMTATPPTVDDELMERLRRDLDEAQVVELTMMVAVENLRSRTNAALGLTSQGFKDSCDVPARAPQTARQGAGERAGGRV